ncbi:MAG TPA: protein kinase [Pirellulales bacterium]|nr:protein kinase [Pirellulales bacterium]
MSLQRLASAIVARWDEGETADAQRELDLHPELAQHKFTAVQLAYEEYCQRVERGEAIDRQLFCHRFQQLRSSLNRLLEVESVLAKADARPPAEAKWPQPGETILGFTVVEELGRGGFGRVYLAREAAVADRLVAVKVTTSAQREAQMLGRFDHPNIVPILSMAADGENTLAIICMPYLGRLTLQDVLDLHPSIMRPAGIAECFRHLIAADPMLPERDANKFAMSAHDTYVDAVLRIAIGICNGLSEAHRQGVLHLDMKPSNVLIDRRGEPMLLDFNLAIERSNNPTRLGGTLPYMAPEQIRAAFQIGEASAVDARADLFSVGVVLYELLTGVRPFELPEPCQQLIGVAATLLQKQTMPFSPARRFNRDVNRGLDGLIRDLLSFDPADRPDSADQTARLLRQQRGPTRRAIRWSLRHRKVTIGLAGTSMLVAGSSLYAWCKREPSVVREYRFALNEIASGNLESASVHLNQALNENGGFEDALLARGRLRIQRNKIGAALADFQAAAKISLSDASLCGQGYCLARTARYHDAIACFRGMSPAGQANAGNANNLGYCLMREHNSDEAERWFNRAVSVKNPPQAAYYNRAVLDLQRSSESGRSKYTPRRGVQDICRAIEIRPECGELYYLRACLIAAVGDDQMPVAAVIGDLKMALQMGIPAGWLKGEYLFRPLIAHPELKAMLQQGGGQTLRPLFQPLVPPE